MATRRTAAIDAGLQFGLRNRWYPVYESADLGHGKAIGIKRLGEELALKRGQWLTQCTAPENAVDVLVPVTADDGCRPKSTDVALPIVLAQSASTSAFPLRIASTSSLLTPCSR